MLKLLVILEARGQELRYLRGRKYLDAICVVLWATTPVLVAAFTLGTHSLRGLPLDAPTVCISYILLLKCSFIYLICNNIV